MLGTPAARALVAQACIELSCMRRVLGGVLGAGARTLLRDEELVACTAQLRVEHVAHGLGCVAPRRCRTHTVGEFSHRGLALAQQHCQIATERYLETRLRLRREDGPDFCEQRARVLRR